jgi:hypothetical protein
MLWALLSPGGVLGAAIRDAGSGTLTPRTVAHVAFILLSIQDAVHMAPLYTRLLFLALFGHSWDDPLVGEPVTFALSDMLYWVDQVPLFEGKTWQRRSHVHFLAGDVSEEAYGGHSSLLCVDIWQPFSAAEIALMLSNQLDAIGVHLQGDMLVFQGDNQAAIHCLRSMKGRGSILPVVKQIYDLARRFDVHIDFQWLPRTSAVIQRADALSRVVDQSQIVLSPVYFQRVCQTKLSCEVLARHPAHGPIWGRPTLDVFAGPADHEHKAPQFFSLYACPGTSGVNALYLDLRVSLPPVSAAIPRPSLLWVFPPFYLIADAILKVMQHRLNAVLVIPCGVRSWTPLLARLPVVASQHLSGPNLVILGRHVPAYMRAPTYHLHLQALLVLFT